MSEYLTYLSDKYHIAIHSHPDLGTKIRRQLLLASYSKDVPLPALFQAIEDFNNGQIQFVVRDYGIVLMNRDQAEKNGFMPLLEFVEAEKQATDTFPDDPCGDRN